MDTIALVANVNENINESEAAMAPNSSVESKTTTKTCRVVSATRGITSKPNAVVCSSAVFG